MTRGITSRLDKIIGTLVDPVSGRFKIENDAFDENLNSIQQSIDRQTELFETRRENLLREFIALESAVAQLQSQSSFLAQQLSSLPTNRNQ